MATDQALPIGIKGLIGFLMFHLLILLTQTWAVFDYDLVAGFKLQEPRILADEAVVQSNRAIGVAHTVVMVPLSCIAIYGLLKHQFYGVICTWMLLGTALYWPVVFLASRFTYKSADIQCVSLQGEDLVLCVLVFLYASWASWYLCRSQQLIQWWNQDFPSGNGEQAPLLSSKK